MSFIDPTKFGQVVDIDAARTLFEDGATVLTVRVRLIGCLCDDPECPARADMRRATGEPEGDTGMSAEVQLYGAPPAVEVAAWEVIEQTLSHGRAEAAGRALRDMLAEGMGGESVQ